MSINITAATWAANQATYTTASAHGLGVGRVVTITGVVPAGYNGVFTTVSGTTGSTIVVAMTTNPGAYSSGGALSNGNQYAPMKTSGIGYDRNGDIWYYTPTGLVWLANSTVIASPAEMSAEAEPTEAEASVETAA